ncbi:MAG: hypothetical protein Q8N51_13240 [Gammaproteobacteria bacterium]|nr:hypothetical protein [Gammaproteobacteria bacterium]
MATLLIRALQASDELRWRPLWQAYLEFYQVDLHQYDVEVAAGTG